MTCFPVLLFFGALAAIPGARGFAFDEKNIERLFGNSDEIFGKIEVLPEEESCVSEFQLFVNFLKINEKFSVRVMDAWAKEPPGLSSGVSMSFGHFDQCLALNDPHPHQVCSIGVENTRNESYKLSICVPRVCLPPTVDKIMGPFFENAGLDNARALHCSSGETPKFGLAQWIALIVCLVLLLAVVGAVIYDLRDQRNLLNVFSVKKNADKVFSQSSQFGSMNCLNGIRVISMLWIVLLHAFQAFYFEFYELLDPHYMKDFELSFTKTFLFGGEYAVDTFFIVSGLLLAFNFMKSYTRGDPFNLLKFYLHRYLRLIPVFAFVVLLLLAIFPYITGPPRENDLLEANVLERCRKFWWSGLLCVQNYVNPKEMCLDPSWYIAADMQLYVLSPLILFPLAKYGRKFLPVMISIALAATAFIFVFCLVNDFQFAGLPHLPKLYWDNVYFPTHGRIMPWLTGIALGYFLFHISEEQFVIKKSLNLLLWSTSFMAVCGIFAVSYSQFESTSALVFALYASLHRPIWTLAISWVIFACIRGYGGPAAWFLNFSFFQPLNKLSYAIYVLQSPIIFLTVAFQRSLAHFSGYLMFHFYLGIVGICLLLAIPVVLVVEMPIFQLESRMWARKTTLPNLNKVQAE